MSKKMKKYLLIISAVICLFLNACSGDGEDKPDTGKGTGQVALYFDHGINGDQLVTEGGKDFTYPSVEGEKLYDIEALDYVISNISLTNELNRARFLTIQKTVYLSLAQRRKKPK